MISEQELLAYYRDTISAQEKCIALQSEKIKALEDENKALQDKYDHVVLSRNKEITELQNRIIGIAQDSRRAKHLIRRCADRALGAEITFAMKSFGMTRNEVLKHLANILNVETKGFAIKRLEEEDVVRGVNAMREWNINSPYHGSILRREDIE